MSCLNGWQKDRLHAHDVSSKLIPRDTRSQNTIRFSAEVHAYPDSYMICWHINLCDSTTQEQPMIAPAEDIEIRTHGM
ncbi:hypothetical protein BgiBS90_024482 [Biomphalaria glabrata]|nr:hypothetical protein BgiBS90_024482 [Biomphalaria glabrata]